MESESQRIVNIFLSSKTQVSTPTFLPTAVLYSWPLESPIIKTHFPDPTASDVTDKHNDALLTETTIQYLDPFPLGFCLQYLGTKFEVTVHTPEQHDLSRHMIHKAKQDMTRFLVSPMPGSVVSIAVKPGDVVSEGAELAIVEAMKMQNVLRASRVGRVKEVRVKEGASVAADEVIVEFEQEKAEE